MGEVINLTEFRQMQKALDDADLIPDGDDRTILVYRDNWGIPQIVIEGESITQIQYDNMPDDIRAMLITQTQE